jgi:hypothetical protein
MTTFGAGSVRGLGRAARLVPPGAPVNFSATGRTRADGAGGATVSFTPPVDNGGAPITAYQIQNVTDNSFQTIYSSGEVVSLSNNAEKTFRVRAVNAAGPGEWSNTDTALAGYWTYNPGNGGGSSTFTVPSGITSIVYQLWSNGGASSKPDTRTYSTAYPAYIDYWGPSTIYGPASPGLPDVWFYHRQFEGVGWWNYDSNWNYMWGNLQYAWGNFQQGGHEYYNIVPQNSGPEWTSGTSIGYYYVTPSSFQIVTSGSAAQGPTSGTSSSISVPGWGSDSTGSGYNGSQAATSGTAYPSANANITVNIGYSNGDHGYSTPGAAIISYGR